MTAHLGPAATAFVDGQLDHRQRDEVLSHLLHCQPCRAEVDGLRALKSSLRGAPEIPFELSLRLLEAIPHVAGPPVQGRPQNRHPRVRRTAFGGALVALGIGGTLGLAGPPPSGPAPRVDPSSVTFVLDHAATAGEVPFTEPGIMSVSHASSGSGR
jgi:anti-sigma factor RsiW